MEEWRVWFFLSNVVKHILALSKILWNFFGLDEKRPIGKINDPATNFLRFPFVEPSKVRKSGRTTTRKRRRRRRSRGPFHPMEMETVFGREREREHREHTRRVQSVPRRRNSSMQDRSAVGRNWRNIACTVASIPRNPLWRRGGNIGAGHFDFESRYAEGIKERMNVMQRRSPLFQVCANIRNIIDGFARIVSNQFQT